ncbi:MAG: hypothetical protein ACHQKY_12050, partial [Terriglobia bacterium]
WHFTAWPELGTIREFFSELRSKLLSGQLIFGCASPSNFRLDTETEKSLAYSVVALMSYAADTDLTGCHLEIVFGQLIAA